MMEFGWYEGQSSQPKHTQITLGRTKKCIHQKDWKSNDDRAVLYLCWMLGHSPSKALPTSHVVPFTNDTLTFYPLHPDGTSPNSNCVYLMIRSAQYRTQRNHCSGPLYKGSSLVPPRTELRANPELLPRCCWSCSQWPCWPWAQLKTQFLVRIRERVLRLCLGLGGSHCSEEACKEET